MTSSSHDYYKANTLTFELPSQTLARVILGNSIRPYLRSCLSQTLKLGPLSLCLVELCPHYMGVAGTTQKSKELADTSGCLPQSDAKTLRRPSIYLCTYAKGAMCKAPGPLASSLGHDRSMGPVESPSPISPRYTYLAAVKQVGLNGCL